VYGGAGRIFANVRRYGIGPEMLRFYGEPQEAYSLGGATGEEVVYIVY